MLTVRAIQELLRYDPATGIFTWRQGKGRSSPGLRAGSDRGKGWRVIEINGRRYAEAALAWLYMTGEWRPRQIDHRDRARGNNRWSNLRLATPKQQQENKGLNRNNTSGVTGVVRVRYGQRWKWRAQIEHEGHQRYLGWFDTKAEAARKRLEVEAQLFTHSTRVGKEQRPSMV